MDHDSFIHSLLTPVFPHNVVLFQKFFKKHSCLSACVTCEYFYRTDSFPKVKCVNVLMCPKLLPTKFWQFILPLRADIVLVCTGGVHWWVSITGTSQSMLIIKFIQSLALHKNYIKVSPTPSSILNINNLFSFQNNEWKVIYIIALICISLIIN